jgi:queuine tRNA-ribosyltransferase
MLGPTLLSLHNLAYYLQLMAEARQAIRDKRFADFQAECQAGWQSASLGDDGAFKP